MIYCMVHVTLKKYETDTAVVELAGAHSRHKDFDIVRRRLGRRHIVIVLGVLWNI